MRSENRAGLELVKQVGLLREHVERVGVDHDGLVEPFEKRPQERTNARGQAGADGDRVGGLRRFARGRSAFAVKIADGRQRALQAVVVALLEELGWVEPGVLGRFYPRAVLSREGDPVGEMRVVL